MTLSYRKTAIVDEASGSSHFHGHPVPPLTIGTTEHDAVELRESLTAAISVNRRTVSGNCDVICVTVKDTCVRRVGFQSQDTAGR
jgi:hypothetical protein